MPRKPTKKETEERKRLYERTRDELLESQLSNSQQYDKAVLTLSSAALGVSVAFISDYVADRPTVGLWILNWSWILLLAAVLLTVCSFGTSQWAISRQLALAQQYYLEFDESALRRSAWAVVTDVLNVLAGIFFGLGLILTVVFMAKNMEVTNMIKQDELPATASTDFGQPVAPMQAAPKIVVTVPETRGAPVASMQPANSAPPRPSSTPQPSSAPAQSSGSGSKPGGK